MREREEQKEKEKEKETERNQERERVSRKCEASVHEVNGLRDSEMIKIE